MYKLIFSHHNLVNALDQVSHGVSPVFLFEVVKSVETPRQPGPDTSMQLSDLTTLTLQIAALLHHFTKIAIDI